MDKAYTKVGWKNSPDTSTPMSAANLNKMDDGIDAVDTRVCELKEEIGDYVTVTIGKNIYTGLNDVNGYISNASGTISASDIWKTTDYIKVEDLENVVLSGSRNGTRRTSDFYFLLGYNNAREPISSTYKNTVSNYYTIEDDVSYIRFAYQPQYNEDVMLESGTVRSEIYEPYTESYTFNGKSTYDSVIDSEIAEINSKILIEHGANFYTGLNDVSGYISNNAGYITPNASWKTTDYIDVSGANNLALSVKGSTGNRSADDLYFFLAYDEDKNPISSTYTNTKSYFTAADDIKYIRFAYHSNVSDLMLEKGTSPSGYYEAYKTINVFNGVLYSENQTKTWAVFGDSLTEHNSRAAKHYYDYVAEELGFNLKNYGMSGTGYKNRDNVNNAFYQRMLNVNQNDFDFMTIFGSFNDLSGSVPLGTYSDSGTDTLCGAINTTIDNFYSVAPFKKLGIVTPTPWVINNFNGLKNTDYENYANALISICENRGIPCLDLFHCSGLKPWDEAFRVEYYNENGIQDTGVHPNSKGHKFIAPMFREFVKKLI